MAKKGEEAEKPKPNLRETVASTLKEFNQSDSRHRSRSRSPGIRSANAVINTTIGTSLSRSLSQVAQESLRKKNANQKEKEKESDSDVCPWSQAAVGIGIGINKSVYTNYKENDRWGPGTALDQTGPDALNWNQPRPKLSPSPSPSPDRGGFNFKRSRSTGWDESRSLAPKPKCRRTGWDLDKSSGRDSSYDSPDPWMCTASLHATSTGTGTGTHSVNPFGESNRQNHPIKDDVSCLACNIFRSAPWCGSNSLKSTLTCTCTSTMAGTGMVTGTKSESAVNPVDPTPKVPKLLAGNTTDRHSFKRALITFAKPKLRPFWLKQHVNDLVYLHILARFVKNVVHSLGTRIPQTHDICKFLREENDSLGRYLQMYLRRFVSDNIIKNMRYDRRSPENSLVFP